MNAILWKGTGVAADVATGLPGSPTPGIGVSRLPWRAETFGVSGPSVRRKKSLEAAVFRAPGRTVVSNCGLFPVGCGRVVRSAQVPAKPIRQLETMDVELIALTSKIRSERIDGVKWPTIRWRAVLRGWRGR